VRRLLSGAGLVVVTAGAAACAAAPSSPQAASAAPTTATPRPAPASPIVLPPSPLTEDQRVLHVLNRLGYGPRPGDIERVRQMGVAEYIARQLDPDRIPDDTAGRAVAAYPVLAKPATQLVREYPQPTKQARERMASGAMTPQEMRELFPPERRPYVIAAQMQAAKLVRATVSDRQLQEVMVDFWFNHFNVFAHKGPVKWMLPDYERDAIRPHALGRFKDLVVATARHPAMLFYLDNWLSTREDFVLPAGPNRGRKMGLNENYARELMELHTLGVDGGYTQQDVIEVARCFTGWTINRPDQGGGFVFRPLAHDQGAKRVLGHAIPAGGGEQDGMQVIDILVHHPSTAKFISTKLARHFVSDDPPPALVERAAATFQRTDGDIRAVLLMIFTSPEFFSAEAYRAKIKSPLQMVASAARALDAELLPPGSETVRAEGDRPAIAERPALAERAGLQVGGGFVLARQVATLGQPLYEMQPPTGYADVAEAWVSTGALLSRMNFALALAHNRLPGARVDLDRLLAAPDRSHPGRVLDRLLSLLLHGQVSAETRSVLAAQLTSPEITRAHEYDRGPKNTDVEKLAALVLGSPEFQRR
jgi:uncharacterized protein (DUF1800 family)